MKQRDTIIYSLLIVLTIGCQKKICAQQLAIDSLINELKSENFENIRAVNDSNKLLVAFENNYYRNKIHGIGKAIKISSNYILNKDKIELILLQKDVPQLNITVLKLINTYYKLSTVESDKKILINSKTNKVWNKLKKQKAINTHSNKIDFIIYPQFYLQNVYFQKIYEIQLNLAPAVEVSLWRGMLFTGQLIFPLVNDLGYEGNYIRPGFVTISQYFRLPGSLTGRLSIGNFNANRYGADINLFYPFAKDRWYFGFNAGITGDSRFYKGQWVKNNLNVITWYLKTGYYYPKFNLQFDFSFGQYLYGDKGFRADCTRYFGETAIGFYAMYSGGESNGGFHFAIPLPPRKRGKRRTLNILPPRFFDWEYNAGTEFIKGRYYEIRPNENRMEQFEINMYK